MLDDGWFGRRSGRFRFNDEFFTGDLFEEKKKRKKRKADGKRKGNRKPWLAFVPTRELQGHVFKCRLEYKEWSAVALDELLRLPDQWFLENVKADAIQVRQQTHEQ